jgi:GNAT superfamily N-acetyltransferase
MDDVALRAAADRNLAFAWATIGRHAGFAVVAGPTATKTASGLPVAFFNGTFTTAPADDPAALVQDVIEFYADRAVPYLLWVRDEADDALLDAGRAAGLRDAGGPPLLALDPIVPGPVYPPALEVALASDDADLQIHREVLAAGFDMPIDIARTLIGQGCLDDPAIAIAIGCVSSVPVATAVLVRSGATAGVFNVATLPEHRGNGYGAALTWAVVAEGARRGCSHAVLQASESGHPVYRRMGFVELGRYVQLAGPPEP